ncbi:hypothetical protein M3484_05020 [Pseudomonas sp. GX19020]|uniref:hypothetical protein n=1 Tax=Pseudomonas sp. GX19020 TaxID=2942277 RepID=UPI00201926F0|nr:hypothetical protein [Pseudomonas sp. GX19020]MCL4065923.1 hypothetical protein [Pseudomonas sp. GX19020]
MARKSTTTRATAKPNTAQTEGQDQANTNTQGETGTGKPDQTHTPPSSLAEQAGGNAGGEGDTAFAAGNTQGANDAGQTAEALLQAPGGPQGSAPGQGGEAEILPATNPTGGQDLRTFEGLEQPGGAGNVLAPEAGATGGGGPADDPAMITVICHAKDGRRRLDRRWPEGETPVPVGELSDTEIAILRGDPRFTVILPT